MTGVQINTRFLKGMLSDANIQTLLQQSNECAKQLEEKTGLGNDFLGW